METSLRIIKLIVSDSTAAANGHINIIYLLRKYLTNLIFLQTFGTVVLLS